MRTVVLSLLGLGISVTACGNGGPNPESGQLGSVHASVEVSDVDHDVTAVRFDIVQAAEACDAPPIHSETAGLEEEPLAGSGTHPFADGLFVLAPGSYRVCATPLAGEGPSAECAPADAVAEVTSGETTELVLDSQCQAVGNGGLGTVLSLNDQPEITSIDVAPTNFVTVCESATITAEATDPNDDPLEYAWSVVSGPDGSSLRADGAAATFSGSVGDYVLELDVSDGHGGTTSLKFPVHVASAVCEVPEQVQAIIDSRCSPCHTTGSSGGLHMSPASASFANLVNVPSSSSACSSRTRVIPGDPDASYIIAKLRGEAGICGVRMPRNLPPLPEQEIATIADWILNLPH
jgi:hypothetical protein